MVMGIAVSKDSALTYNKLAARQYVRTDRIVKRIDGKPQSTGSGNAIVGATIMSIPCKFEQSLLKHDEQQLVLTSHHPEIYDATLDDLKALRQRLRDMRNKERTLAREKRREKRGKAAPRRASFPAPPNVPINASRCLSRRSNA